MQTTSYLYRPILKKAWQITFKYWKLWFFGLFAVLISAGGEYEIISRAFYNQESGGILTAFATSLAAGWQEGSKLSGGNFWQNLSRLITTQPGFLATALFVFFLIVALSLFVIWLSISSEIALIKGCSLAGRNRSLGVGEGLDGSIKNFWWVLIIVAIFKVIIFILLALIAGELWLLGGTGLIGSFIYVVSFVIFVLLVLVASFIFKYQTFFVVLKNKKFSIALKSAWSLFENNWLISLEMALLMFGVYLVAAVLSAFLISLASGVAIIIVPLYLSGAALALKYLIAGLAALLAIIGVLLLTSIMTTFQWAGWTALFERLVGEDDVTSKTERIAQIYYDLPKVIRGK